MGSQPAPAKPEQGLGTAQRGSEMQQNFNVATQAGNQYSQETPFGGLNYVQTGVGPNGVPTYTAVTNLSPEQQALLGQRTISQLIGGQEATNLLGGANYGAAPPWEQIGSMTSGLTGQQMAMETSFLDPFFKLQQQQMDTQLQNQGFTPGTTAYYNAMMPMLVGQNLDVSNFLAQAFPSQEQFAAQLYGMPLALASQMMGFSGPTMPGSQFVSGPQMQAPNVASIYGPAQQAAVAQQQQAQQQYNAMISALGGLGGALMFGPIGGMAGSALGGALGGALGPGSGSYSGVGGWT